MRFKRDSLLFKVVFYNNLAIAISTITVAVFLTYMNMETKYNEIKINAGERIAAVKNSYEKNIDIIRGELIAETSNFDLIVAQNSNSEEEYRKIVRAYRDRIIKKDSTKFYESTVALFNGKGDLLAESGLISDREVLTMREDEQFSRMIRNGRASSGKYYLQEIDGRLYARIYFPYYISYEKYFMLVTVPLSYDLLQKVKSFIALGNKDKMFLIADRKYYAGDFFYGLELPILGPEGYEFFKRNRDKNFYYENEIENTPYYIATYSFKDPEGNNIGYAGIALSKEQFYREKKILTLLVALMVMLFILMGVTIFTRIFGRMFRPLLDITTAAEEIGRGNYDYNIEPSSTEFGEIQKLNSSFRKMLKEIKNNHGILNKQNIKLRENITRIEAIEKLLLGLHFEEEVNDLIKTLLLAFTSERGLGYGRAMYFRYSREADHLLGEMSAYNENLENLLSKKMGKGFDFQIKDLDGLVKYIKIPYKANNLIAKALIDRKVVYFNQKGYKYNLGNDLFKSLGINNFLIIPIYSKKRNIGCILVDYFDFNKPITQEEYELINLLAMNVSMRIRNKHLEEEKLDRERNFTITRLLERFLTNREIFLNNIEDIIERYHMGQSDFHEEFEKILPTIDKLKKENTIFREYSHSLNNRFEKIEVESIFNEIVNEEREESLRNGVILSVFNNCSSYIYGDRIALKKAFYEIMKNSYNSLLKTKKQDKKINVVISKDKNIDKLTIRIIDNGIGMTQQQLERIYEPFASLNGDTPGLGLSLVYKIIKAHSGIIKYYSKHGEGTEAKITLNIYKGDDNL